MTTPQSDLVVLESVGEVKNNADNLALTWEIRPATVNAMLGGIASVVMDGDTSVTPALSLVGSIGVGDRVHIIQIPPSGNYVVGFAYGAALAQMASFKGLANAPQQVSSTSFANVLSTGAAVVTVSVTKQRTSSRIAYNLVTDAFATAIGDTVEYGFRINGTDYDVAGYFFNAAADHRTVAGVGIFTTLELPAGTHDFTLRWRNPSGNAVNMDANSWITFQLYEVAPLPT